MVEERGSWESGGQLGQGASATHQNLSMTEAVEAIARSPIDQLPRLIDT